jgi:hypothetical protein
MEALMLHSFINPIVIMITKMSNQSREALYLKKESNKEGLTHHINNRGVTCFFLATFFPYKKKSKNERILMFSITRIGREKDVELFSLLKKVAQNIKRMFQFFYFHISKSSNGWSSFWLNHFL